jgi:hypothetical protein
LLAGIHPPDLGRYTPGELVFMVQASYEQRDLERRDKANRYATLAYLLATGLHVGHEDGTELSRSDVLPPDMVPARKPMSDEEMRVTMQRFIEPTINAIWGVS